jgi:hypothetical protein
MDILCALEHRRVLDQDAQGSLLIIFGSAEGGQHRLRIVRCIDQSTDAMLVGKSVCSFETADQRSHIVARHSIHRFSDLPSNNVLRSPPVDGIAKLSTSTVEKSFRCIGWGLPEQMAEAECQ